MTQEMNAAEEGDGGSDGASKSWLSRLGGRTLRDCVILMLGALDFGYSMSFLDPASRYLPKIFNPKHDSKWQDVFRSIFPACAIFGPIFTNGLIGRMGRQKLMFTYALVSTICWLLFFVIPTADTTPDVIWLSVVIRGIAGLSIGALSALTPLYLVELAPKDATGFFGTLNQVGIAIGFVICYLVDLSEVGKDPKVWWYLLVGIGLIAPFALMFLVWIVSESPVVLDPAPPPMAYTPTWQDPLLKPIPSVVSQSIPESLFSRPWRWKLIICCLLMLFQQTSGVNIILVNLAHQFDSGPTTDYSLPSRQLSVGSSFTQVVTSMLGAFLIDRWGRRFIWTVSLSGIAVVLAIYAGILGKHRTAEIALMFLFISLFGLGCGPIPWFFGAEDRFPGKLVPQAMSIIASVNWLFACLVMQIQSNYAGKSGYIGRTPATFAALAVCSLAGAIFGFFFVSNPPAAARSGQVIDEDPYDDRAQTLACC